MHLLPGNRPLQIAVFLTPALLFGNVSWAQMAGLRYWTESPDTEPGGLGFRAGITFLFSKK